MILNQPKKLSRLFLALLLALFIANPVQARDYIVDLVIFEHLSRAVPSDYSRDLYYPIVRNPVYLGTENAKNSGFLEHGKNPEMTAIVSRLESSSRYSVIDHFSWQQPGLEAELARPLKLTYGDEVNLYLPMNAEGENGLIAAMSPGMEVNPDAVEIVETSRLSGSVTLSLGRFLHLASNLVLIQPEGNGTARLQTSRRMRSNEVHYIDNPRFGLIVLVTPVPEEENDDENEGES